MNSTRNDVIHRGKFAIDVLFALTLVILSTFTLAIVETHLSPAAGVQSDATATATLQ